MRIEVTLANLAGSRQVSSAELEKKVLGSGAAALLCNGKAAGEGENEWHVTRKKISLSFCR